MTSGQCFLGGLAVECLGDLVDGFCIGFGTGDPLGTHRQSVHCIDVFVSGGRDAVIGKEAAGIAQGLCLRAIDGQKSNATAARGQLGNGAGRCATHEEECIQCAIFHFVGCLVGLDVFGFDFRFFDVVSSQNEACIDQSA